MTPELSSLIKQRQKALKQGNALQFKYLRNRVNRKRKSCRAKYYAKSVQHLKQCTPSAWWDEVKKLSGRKSVYKNNEEILSPLRPPSYFSEIVKVETANQINNSFLSPMRNFTPLPQTCYLAILTISVLQLPMKMCLINFLRLTQERSMAPTELRCGY